MQRHTAQTISFGGNCEQTLWYMIDLHVALGYGPEYDSTVDERSSGIFVDGQLYTDFVLVREVPLPRAEKERLRRPIEDARLDISLPVAICSFVGDDTPFSYVVVDLYARKVSGNATGGNIVSLRPEFDDISGVPQLQFGLVIRPVIAQDVSEDDLAQLERFTAPAEQD
ncbi:hypothetical protein JNJ66_02930 [Candidatus Saccharibacteria bacterium]|nr:hypothetical protein [Candidatus Saccharibacteria bacterium]